MPPLSLPTFRPRLSRTRTNQFGLLIGRTHILLRIDPIRFASERVRYDKPREQPFEKLSSKVGVGRAFPQRCRAQQIHMASRNL
jgi:hypothetical protein